MHTLHTLFHIPIHTPTSKKTITTLSHSLKRVHRIQVRSTMFPPGNSGYTKDKAPVLSALVSSQINAIQAQTFSTLPPRVRGISTSIPNGGLSAHNLKSTKRGVSVDHYTSLYAAFEGDPSTDFLRQHARTIGERLFTLSHTALTFLTLSTQSTASITSFLADNNALFLKLDFHTAIERMRDIKDQHARIWLSQLFLRHMEIVRDMTHPIRCFMRNRGDYEFELNPQKPFSGFEKILLSGSCDTHSLQALIMDLMRWVKTYGNPDEYKKRLTWISDHFVLSTITSTHPSQLDDEAYQHRTKLHKGLERHGIINFQSFDDMVLCYLNPDKIKTYFSGQTGYERHLFERQIPILTDIRNQWVTLMDQILVVADQFQAIGKKDEAQFCRHIASCLSNWRNIMWCDYDSRAVYPARQLNAEIEATCRILSALEKDIQSKSLFSLFQPLLPDLRTVIRSLRDAQKTEPEALDAVCGSIRSLQDIRSHCEKDGVFFRQGTLWHGIEKLQRKALKIIADSHTDPSRREVLIRMVKGSLFGFRFEMRIAKMMLNPALHYAQNPSESISHEETRNAIIDTARQLMKSTTNNHPLVRRFTVSQGDNLIEDRFRLTTLLNTMNTVLELPELSDAHTHIYPILEDAGPALLFATNPALPLPRDLFAGPSDLFCIRATELFYALLNSRNTQGETPNDGITLPKALTVGTGACRQRSMGRVADPLAPMHLVAMAQVFGLPSEFTFLAQPGGSPTQAFPIHAISLLTSMVSGTVFNRSSLTDKTNQLAHMTMATVNVATDPTLNQRTTQLSKALIMSLSSRGTLRTGYASTEDPVGIPDFPQQIDIPLSQEDQKALDVFYSAENPPHYAKLREISRQTIRGLDHGVNRILNGPAIRLLAHWAETGELNTMLESPLRPILLSILRGGIHPFIAPKKTDQAQLEAQLWDSSGTMNTFLPSLSKENRLLHTIYTTMGEDPAAFPIWSQRTLGMAPLLTDTQKKDIPDPLRKLALAAIVMGRGGI